jgi:5-(carboxyamino)imidazole ribonucleotide synthase
MSIPATIGILGGGQLGRMLTLEAKRMGFRVVTLELLPDSPCGQVADTQIVAPYDDLKALAELGAQCDVITYEFENIPLHSLQFLERENHIVRPSSEVLRITQNRGTEKTFAHDIGLRTAGLHIVRGIYDFEAAIARLGLPLVLKTAFGGYDGKSQWIVRSLAEGEIALKQATERAKASAHPFPLQLLAEAFVPFDCEISVIAARNIAGEHILFPASENTHDSGILVTAIVPARVSEAVAAEARAATLAIGEKLNLIGAYCVEFFVRDEKIYVNEIAPRVHNSGHYSLDTMTISQYEAHVRAICNLPLVESRLLEPSVMINILGQGTGNYLERIPELLRDPCLKLHLYGKRHAPPRRKMGHITIHAPTLDEAMARAARARELLTWTHVRPDLMAPPVAAN